MKLENSRQNEEIKKVIRRHWVIFFMLGLILIFGCLLTVISILMFGGSALVFLLNICFWMYYILFWYVEWINSELDLYIITNFRIIGIEQDSFLNRHVNECGLGQVQEVSGQTKGFWANMLNFGGIKIQTAGNSSHFGMDFAPDPMKNSGEILQIVHEYVKPEEKFRDGVSQNVAER